MKIIKNFDFLSGKVEIGFNGSSRVKSVIGGTVSMLFLAVGLVVFGLMAVEIVSKNKPFVSITEVESKEDKIYLKDFPLAFSVRDERARDMTERVFSKGLMNGDQLTITPEGKVADPQQLILTKCDERTAGRFYSIYKKISTSLVCFDPYRSINMETKEIEERDIYFSKGPFMLNSRSLNFYLTGDKSVFPSQRPYFVAMVSPQHFVDERNFEKPITVEVSNFSWRFYNDVYSVVEPSFQLNSLVTDKGWLLTLLDTINFVQTVSSKETMPKLNDNVIFRIECRVLSTVKVKYREYIKLPGLLANYGGIMKVFQVIFMSFSRLYSRFVLFQHLQDREQPVEKNREVSNSEYPSKIGFIRFIRLTYFTSDSKCAKVLDQLELDRIIPKEHSNRTVFRLTNHSVNSRIT